MAASDARTFASKVTSMAATRASGSTSAASLSAFCIKLFGVRAGLGAPSAAGCLFGSQSDHLSRHQASQKTRKRLQRPRARAAHERAAIRPHHRDICVCVHVGGGRVAVGASARRPTPWLDAQRAWAAGQTPGCMQSRAPAGPGLEVLRTFGALAGAGRTTIHVDGIPIQVEHAWQGWHQRQNFRLQVRLARPPKATARAARHLIRASVRGGAWLSAPELQSSRRRGALPPCVAASS